MESSQTIILLSILLLSDVEAEALETVTFSTNMPLPLPPCFKVAV
jgi:hypothetical protein